MRKAQIEAMGLIVVVILVTIALFISISLKQPQPVKKALEVYTDETMAGNFLVALMEVQVEVCGGVTGSIVKMEDLAEDCVRIHQTAPPEEDQGKYRCEVGEEEKNACEMFADITKQLLVEILDKWGVTYDFAFHYYGTTVDEDLFTYPADEQCDPTTTRSASGLQLLALPYDIHGSALLRLRICNP